MHQPARRIERRAWPWLLALLLLFAGWPAARAQAPAAEVTQLQVERTDEGVLLSASVQFELPEVVEDALDKGISMFFVAEATIYRDRWYWYDKRVATAIRHFRLSYQPLTRRWRLQVSPQPITHSGLVLGQIFDSREEALSAMRRISRWRIADPGDVDPQARNEIDFRFRLDVSQLPRPFQIGAVGQSDWIILAVRRQPLDLAEAR